MTARARPSSQPPRRASAWILGPVSAMLLLLAVAGPVAAEVACGCSCAEPPPPADAVAAHLEEPGAAIVSGVVTSTDERTVRLEVDTWYAGPDPAPAIQLSRGRLPDGGCVCVEVPDPGRAALLLVSWHRELDAYIVPGCGTWAYLDDPGAGELVAAVEAAVGPGTPGAALPATDTEAADDAPPVIPIRHFAAAVLVATVFVGMLAFALGPAPRRRR